MHKTFGVLFGRVAVSLHCKLEIDPSVYSIGLVLGLGLGLGSPPSSNTSGDTKRIY